MIPLGTAVPADTLQTPWQWIIATLGIILIDVVLAGDNAVAIALAVRRLNPKERLWGIALGSVLAVSLRVVLTFYTAKLLGLNFIRLIGGVLILWIAIKLLLDNTGDDTGQREAATIWQAIWVITLADITMSLDNVLAVAGASRGSFGLLLFGLGLSIPLVVFTSNLLAKLMDRYPLIIYIGSAILGKVGGGMIVTDTFVVDWLHPTQVAIYATETLAAIIVILIPWLVQRLKKPATPSI